MVEGSLVTGLPFRQIVGAGEKWARLAAGLVVRLLAEKRAKINADAKSEGVQVQGHTAAIVELQIEVGTWLHFRTGVESIVSH